jgi:hypothetical protein
MMTSPSDVAGGAADGLDERARAAQEALLVGVEDRHQGDLGQVEALAQQVDADQHVELAAAQIAQDLDALEGVDVAVQVADAHAELGVVLGEILGHALGERGDEHALVRFTRSRMRASRRSSTWPATGRTVISGSMRPVGRMICSTTTPSVLLELVVAGVALTKSTFCVQKPSNSSNLSGRLSSALGRRKPCSTRVSLRARSPRYMAPTCGMVWCDSSMSSRKSFGK